MKSILCIALVACAGIAAAAAPAPEIRHYTHEEWQAIYSKFTDRPRPGYPASARATRHTGRGMFRMYIDTQGHVTAVKVLRSTGYSELDAAAVNTLRRWRGKPGPKWDLDMPITFVAGQR